MGKSCIVIGGGGHARVLMDALLLSELEIEGFVDLGPKEISIHGKRVKYLGTDEEFLRVPNKTPVILSEAKDLLPAEGGSASGGRFFGLRSQNDILGNILLVNGIGSVGDPARRREIFHRFKELGHSFMNVIHPSAAVAKDVKLGEGVQIMAGAVVQTGCVLGDNVIINTRASVDHDCVIEDHVHIAPGAVLSGNVTVGESAHIGTGACVVQGIRIPEGMFVKAGTTVVRSPAVKNRVLSHE